ncbi:Uma2 family endonuclease [Saccharothrix obliqua]|uniref:Uma2 family endonuclease n=1 Tax=Saccharothrix obliqua TaxID=2861747 RepID=UPI001C5DF969|nr:Uma2 family endonuclease [Saccharothrix obliqua]MBW4720032.1 Uma2 family endonuclease [Saccharothrix obliqua]
MPDHLPAHEALRADGGHRFEPGAGVLRRTPRPAPIHQRAAQRLAVFLDDVSPAEFAVFAGVDVLVDAAPPMTVRALDVVVVAARPEDEYPTRFDAGEVSLAVEVVSPGSADRRVKPPEYGGIPHFWLVELDPPATLTAFTLVDGDYEHVAGGTGLVDVLSPFPATVDLPGLVRNSAGR